ncbi:MAG: type I CRISPR-associated protein Cas7 [Candidatus Omnitrophica bacterium]|nr:type I CRISPR-associated protein Cas7 [Candidatus Omnitrophota bacterium]MBU4478462.1 type I CRISPR-associated protein Cas7 [Candidatus Omnitrophota bacterium]
MNSETILRATGLLVIEAINSNPNGDPDRESDPRQRPDGRGEISPVSFKRKLRDLVEDKEGPVWKKLSEKMNLKNDEFDILEQRGRKRDEIKKELEGKAEKFIKRYWDGRLFGNTFLEDAMDKGTIKTGVVQFVMGLSTSPVLIDRQTNTNKAGVQEGKNQGMAPLAYRVVEHGVYWMPFFVNPSMAHKSGCTKKDIDLMKALIPYAYAHNRSAIRPFVEIRQAWYCEHQNPLGSCSDFAIIDALKPKKKGDVQQPSTCWADYEPALGLSEELKKKVSCKDLMQDI